MVRRIVALSGVLLLLACERETSASSPPSSTTAAPPPAAPALPGACAVDDPHLCARLLRRGEDIDVVVHHERAAPADVTVVVRGLHNLAPTPASTVTANVAPGADVVVAQLHVLTAGLPTFVDALTIQLLPPGDAGVAAVVVDAKTGTTPAPGDTAPASAPPTSTTPCNAFAEQAVCAISVDVASGGADVWLKNTTPAVITARFAFLAEGDVPTDAVTDVVVAAGAVVRAAHGSAQRWRAHLDWQFGDKNAPVDDVDGGAVYSLPWDRGERHQVLQGAQGRFSHQDKQAWDFALAEGSRILAARGGVVAFAADSSKIGGGTQAFVEDGNFLLVVHDDGTVGHYGHLRFAGAWKNVGERVDEGDLLAVSGNTGFSTEPHLHFQVQVPVDGKSVRTIPVRFRTTEGPQVLTEGWVARP